LRAVSKYQAAWSHKQALTLIQELLESDPTVKGSWFQFGIELQKTGELIGDVGFLYSDELEKSWIGFTLDPTYWGNGYATEAASTVLEFYSKHGVSNVWASTEPDNHSSTKVLTRLGFSLMESTLKDLIFRKTLK